jgi:phosphoribosyl-ATP pyrophosphohydrolase/phosphoribosyl-AMP cyclohydrolase
MRWIEQLAFDANGLVPVVTQEVATGEVLMLAFANREAVELTLSSGRAHYWSRSRSRLWQKGETSGHVQEVVDVRVDCDADTLLYLVRQTGPACHTGEGSCFHRRPEGEELAPAAGGGHVLARIEEVVRARESERPEGSYTTYLFDKGIDKILKKVGEEATEVVIAAKNGDAPEIRAEAADLFFHLLVMLRARGVPLSEVWEELETRFGAQSRLPRDAAAQHPHS